MQKTKKKKNFSKQFKIRCIMQSTETQQAEVIFNRVDGKKENIGLTNFKGNMSTRAETNFLKY